LSLKISHIAGNILDQWDAFIEAHPEGSVLQSHFFYKLFEASRNFEPVFVYCTDNEQLVGVLLGVIIREANGIKGWFSSRLVVYGGPLIQEKHPLRNEIFNLLVQHLILITSRKAIFIQFRASYDLNEFRENFENLRFRWHPRINLLIDTSDQDRVISGMSESRIRQVRKSLKNGASISEAISMEQVKELYSIFRVLYSERVKKPLPNLSFFESFFEASKKNSNGKIFLVLFRGKIVGGILCPFWNNKTIFEWYICGLDKEFRQYGIYPSVLATWAAIDYAARHSFKKFDFMGLGKPEVKYGVRDFKLKFGGEVVNNGRYIRVNRPIVYWMAEIGYNLLSFFKKI
jgi:lipid II:glycine glycyltransferase (peptidoglycan interpeptide bridge formation enzyme)